MRRRVEQARERLRSHIAPPVGSGYELWDLTIFAWIVCLASYLLSVPSTAQAVALSWLIGPTTLGVWGYLLNGAMIVGIVCSYVPSAVWIGRAVVIGMSVVWSTVLTLGWVADWPTDADVLNGLAPGMALGMWAFVVVLVVFTFTDRHRRAITLLRATEAGLAVFAVVALLGALGDPRPFSVAVLFGFVARAAIHQGEVHGSGRG